MKKHRYSGTDTGTSANFVHKSSVHFYYLLEKIIWQIFTSVAAIQNNSRWELYSIRFHYETELYTIFVLLTSFWDNIVSIFLVCFLYLQLSVDSWQYSWYMLRKLWGFYKVFKKVKRVRPGWRWRHLTVDWLVLNYVTFALKPHLST